MNKIDYKDIRKGSTYEFNYKPGSIHTRIWLLVIDKNNKEKSVSGWAFISTYNECVTYPLGYDVPKFVEGYDLIVDNSIIVSSQQISPRHIDKVFGEIVAKGKNAEDYYRRLLIQFESREAEYISIIKQLKQLNKPFWKRIFRK